MVNLLAFAATHRKDSSNRKLLSLAVQCAQSQGASVETVEYGLLDMPIYDDEQFDPSNLPKPLTFLAEKLNKAHGVLITSPEYNWSFPGSLKNIIDWVSRLTPQPLKDKTAFLLSASPSLKGGALGLMQLRVPLEHLEVHVYPRMYTLSLSHEKMNPHGQLHEPAQHALLEQMVLGYVQTTKALRGI